jgi:hypothetical protein
MSDRDNKTFFRTVYPVWKDTVTSGHSAPYWIWGAVATIAVLVAPFGENYWIKLAIACVFPAALFLTSAYAAASSVWQSEHLKANKLADQLTPKFSVAIPKNDGVLTIPVQNNALSKWVQIVVQSTTDAPLVDCQIWVNDIIRLNGDGVGTSIFDESARCEWSQREGDEKFNLTIRPGVPQRANLFMLLEQEQPPVPHPTLDFVKIILNVEIQTPGEYRILLAATAKGVRPVYKTLVFRWRDFDNISLVSDETSASPADLSDVPSQPLGQCLGSRQ